MTARIGRSAVVWRGDEIAGRLTRTKDGGVFEYDEAFVARERPSWDRGLSYHLPFSSPRVETRGTNLHPFFAGLLPEGVRLRALLRRVKTSEDDLLSLVIAAGADCIGDVSVTSEEEPEDVRPTVELARVGEVRFRELLAESLAGTRGSEPGLPGVQEKISAGMISLPLRAKERGRPSFILKLTPEQTPRLVENESFFLQMAAAAGLSAARASLVHDRDGETGLLVERFDRLPSRSGVHKVHQEDACQFLDRYPADKYAVSCADIARGMAEMASAPVPELAKFLRLIAFSYLIANGDLHAKNISLRTTVDGRIEMTPAYDILSTLPYGNRTMALALDGRDDNLTRPIFVAFGERFGVRARATEAMLDQLCDVAPDWIARIDEIGLPPRKAADLARLMKKRRDDLAPGAHSIAKRRAAGRTKKSR